MIAFQSSHLQIFLGAVAIKQNIKARRGYPVDLCRKACLQAATSANPKKKLEDFPGTREFGRHRAVQQTRWIGNQDSGTQTINFRVVLHHKLLKQSGFSGILYHFVCLSVLHTLHVDPSYRALRCSAFKALL